MARVTVKYNPDDTVYLVESNRIIRKVKILKFSGGFYTARFVDGGGGIRVRESRLMPQRKKRKPRYQNKKRQLITRHIEIEKKYSVTYIKFYKRHCK